MGEPGSKVAIIATTSTASSSKANSTQIDCPFVWNDVNLYRQETYGQYIQAKGEYTGVGAVQSVHPAVLGLREVYPPFVSYSGNPELMLPIHPASFCPPETQGVDELMERWQEKEFGLDRYTVLCLLLLSTRAFAACQVGSQRYQDCCRHCPPLCAFLC
jgi:hypothetical protein